jgi:tetratricopeptide (TPR) repeat protein
MKRIGFILIVCMCALWSLTGQAQEVASQEKAARLQLLRTFPQKGTKVFVQANCWDEKRFEQLFLNEFGAKGIWRIVFHPGEADFILRVQAMPRPYVNFIAYDIYFLVFDREEHLLWKSDIYLGHHVWTTVNSDLLKAATGKFIKSALLNDIRNTKHVYGETPDILGMSQVSEEKFESSDEWYWKGIDHLSHYEHGAAVKMFTKAIELNPGHALAYKYRALAYYHLSKYKNARPDIVKAMKLDPLNRQNDTIYISIMSQKNEKFMRVWGPGGTIDRINNTLVAVNTALASAASTNSSAGATATTVTPATGKPSGGVTVGRQSCSFCNGTGYNPARERPAFYDSTTEDYSSGMCDICGSNSNHYHKQCPSCAGKGYRPKIGAGN